MAGDWIKLHRKIVDSRVFSDHKILAIWIWCLCRAGYKPRFFQGQEIQPGQFITGRNSGSEELGLSASTFYRGLKKLEEWGQVSLKVNSKWTTVTICNWRTYQDNEGEGWTANEQQMNSSWTADEQLVDTRKESKEREERREGEKEWRAPADPPSGKSRKRKAKAGDDRDYSADFLRFWEIFPPVRKGSKPVAWQAWREAVRRADAEVIIAAAEEFAASDLAKSEYCPGPAPWLNQDRWEDDREAWRRRDGPKNGATHDPKYAPMKAL